MAATEMSRTGSAEDDLDSLRRMLATDFPSLHALAHQRGVLIAGTFQLIEDGVHIDSFLIAVELPATYPFGLPVAREVGGRIPSHSDYHVSGDGVLCVGLPEELWLRYAGRFELKEYLEGPLRSYLIGVCEKFAGRPWPYGEWAHGAPALHEFYGKAIGTNDASRVTELVRLLAKGAVKGHWVCPCGSGKEIRRCHIVPVRELHQKLPDGMIVRSLQILSDKGVGAGEGAGA